MSAATTASSATPRRDGLSTALLGIAVIVAVGIPIQAFLASYGLFEGESGFVTAHRFFGMVLVLLIAAQVGISALLAQRSEIGRGAVIGGFVTLIIYIVQLGLGFATRENASLAAWHIPLGVLLMGGSVMNVVRVRAWRAGAPMG